MVIKSLQLKRALRSVLLVLLLSAAGMGKISAQNLITNGDFEYGNTGFLTDYIYTPTGGVDAGHYCVDVNSTGHGIGTGWPNIPGYGGSGKYLLVNGYGGAINPTKVVWKQTVNVTANTDYVFSCQVVNLGQSVFGYSPNPAVLRLKINGSNVGSDLTIAQNNSWHEWTNTWSSGPGVTQAIIEIYDVFTGESGLGDDFGLDHFSLTPQATYSANAVDDDASLCGLYSSVQIDVLANDIITPSSQMQGATVQVMQQAAHGTANWNNNTRKFQYTYTDGAWTGVLDQFKYRVTIPHGEYSEAWVYVTIGRNPNVGWINAPGPICAGGSLGIQVPSVEPNIGTGQWEACATQTGTFTPFDANNVPITMNGWYVRYTATNDCGEGHSNSVQITVNDAPSIGTIQAPPAINAGGSFNLTQPAIQPNGSTISNQGWQIAATQNGNYSPFDNNNVPYSYNGYWIRYFADNDCGVGYSNAVQITVYEDDDDIIVFADANVKAICVTNWDTDEDGELSYAEAAAVTDLGQVFYYKTGITSFNELKYFTGLTSIGRQAFQGCSGLTSIVIPNSVASIGFCAFYYCTGLTSIIIPNSVISIGSSAFTMCSRLSSIEIPNSVTSIGSSAFSNCTGLTSIDIPDSVTSIEYDAFWRCTSLTTVTIPQSVTSMGENPFAGCSGLEHIIVDSWNTAFDSRENCNAIIETSTNELVTGCKNTTIPNSVTSIGFAAFSGCSGLTSINIPNSVISIGNFAFVNCNSLASIAMSNSLTSIGHYAFWYCSGLTSIDIPNSVTFISHGAFESCSGLATVTIPSSVTSIESNPFGDCDGLEQIVVDSGNTVYDSREDCNAIIETNTNTIISGCKNTVIPNSVTSIGFSAFYGCSGLASINIPNSVIYIDYEAFNYCDGLTSITVLAVDPPVLDDDVFYDVSKEIPVYVPYNTIGTYQTASHWCEFMNYQEICYTTISGYGESEGNYRFIASPLVENTAPTAVDNMITDTAYDLYRFDQNEDAEWQNYKFPENTPNFFLANGQGYLYANAEDVNLIFKGNFNQDEMKEVELVYDEGMDFAGWNLVGNPFPVNAYANKSYYTMNEEGTAIEPNMVSSATAIPACTGVMVMAEAEGEAVVFSTEAPETASNKGCLQVALSQAVELVETQTLRQAQGPALLDKAIVSFNQGDALEKFVFGKADAQISIPQGGKEFAIATVNVGTDVARNVSTNEIPLNFKAEKNGTYTLSFDLENVELDYLHLIDNLTGADVDLLTPPACGHPLSEGEAQSDAEFETSKSASDSRTPAGPSPSERGPGGVNQPRQANYSFSAKTTDYANRFRLVFSDGAASGDACEPVFAYISNGNIVITADAHGASLQIVDAMGRVVVCRDTSNVSAISTNGMAPGVYVLRLISGDDVRTQKIVLP